MVYVCLIHHECHQPYFDVTMPTEAIEIIWDHVEVCTPQELVAKIQQQFPNVSSSQIYTSWAQMSEILWKRDKDQLTSANILLNEYGDDVDHFKVTPLPDVQIIAFGMKKIANTLSGHVVEVAQDATYNTNSKHLELYSILGEHDGAGYPLGYCLLSTASSITIDKLAKNKLSTTPYNAIEAHQQFPFIDADFTPPGMADKTEYEGSIPEDIGTGADISPPVYLDPNSITLRIPPSQPRKSPQMIAKTEVAPRNTVPLALPPPLTQSASTTKGKQERCTFCPLELQEGIVNMMENHLCAHPLIPGYSAPSKDGIHAWAVKQMYQYCKEHDLHEAWAYLWGNWYRDGRWEFWARSPCEREILRLKTTMLCESHWRRIKHDYLHHFHQPRVDLLIWILVKKLGPTYEQKLAQTVGNIGRYCDMASWRKPFKAKWKRCEAADIPRPINSKYKPNPQRWVCTCLAFSKSRFLLCKHLVQSVHPPLNDSIAPNPILPIAELEALHIRDDNDPIDDEGNARNDDAGEDEEEVMILGMYDGRLDGYMAMLRDFADGLEYQQQSHDYRMLDMVERRGAPLFRLIEECRRKEQQMNSTRGTALSTWDPSTIGAMYYRGRPLTHNS
ncbi:hypothetical protein Moror_3617 [Moniliophthora roreri MCA 2997]|uniref:SWIM-type domain-containing protein n=2 Tax=Moniliophthora roreri TaxID=221103 RepID=V2WU52_MONRO|nr:hypothetical protein Moror_3617 [Moniliophthora roreri MCA 2997]